MDYLFIIAPSPGAFGVAIMSLIDLSCVFPRKAFDLISLWWLLPPPQISTKFWVFCLHALIWAIWKERNRRVFENSSADLSQFGIPLYIWFLVGPNAIALFLLIPLYPFVVIFCRFSFFMRTFYDFIY